MKSLRILEKIKEKTRIHRNTNTSVVPIKEKKGNTLIEDLNL
jgi:hypothetical protein